MTNVFMDNLYKPNVVRFSITSKTEPEIGIYVRKNAGKLRIFVNSMIYTYIRGENWAKAQIDVYGVPLDSSDSDPDDNALASKSAPMPGENTGFFELNTYFDLDSRRLWNYDFLGVDVFITGSSLKDKSPIYIPILRTIEPIIKVGE
jgi:hypothetical protein